MWLFFFCFFSILSLFNAYLIPFLLFCLHSISPLILCFVPFCFMFLLFLPDLIFLNYYLFRERKIMYRLLFLRNIILNSLRLSALFLGVVNLSISPLCSLKFFIFPEFLVFCASCSLSLLLFFYPLVTSSSASF